MDEASGSLEPFIHQVGGTSPLFCLDSRTVCKPQEEREHRFYCSLPTALLPFTPQFRGSMRVTIQEDQQGYISVSPHCATPQPSQPAGRPRLRLRRCGSLEIRGPLPGLSIEIETSEQGVGQQYFTDGDPSQERQYNPWALKCHRENLKKVGIDVVTEAGAGACQQYILLENLTSRHTRPCVLDLKVGTRLYGDSATAGKMERKVAKLANSTSVEIGLRLGGMQVWSCEAGRYHCRTKTAGRALTVAGLRAALAQFFSSGDRIRAEVVSAVLEKLAELRSLVASLNSYRFYTSSLLVIYEGTGWTDSRPAPATPPLADVRLIDFAHSTHSGLEEEARHDGPDRGLLLGLDSLLGILGDLQHGPS